MLRGELGGYDAGRCGSIRGDIGGRDQEWLRPWRVIQFLVQQCWRELLGSQLCQLEGNVPHAPISEVQSPDRATVGQQELAVIDLCRQPRHLYSGIQLSQCLCQWIGRNSFWPA